MRTDTDPLWDLIFPFKCAQTTTTEKKIQTVTLNITVDLQCSILNYCMITCEYHEPIEIHLMFNIQTAVHCIFKKPIWHFSFSSGCLGSALSALQDDFIANVLASSGEILYTASSSGMRKWGKRWALTAGHICWCGYF